jgi:ribosomal protein S18 acetylase RimI-like enzyme
MRTLTLDHGEEIVIRRWELEDIPGLYQVMNRVFQEGKMVAGQPLPFSVEDMYEEWHVHNPANQMTWVAFSREKGVIGWLRCDRRPMPIMQHTASVWMGLEEAYRGQTVGQELIRESFEWAKAQGIERLELGVRGSNIQAQDLYRQMGFREEGRKVRAIKTADGYEDDIWMCAFVDDAPETRLQTDVAAGRKKKLRTSHAKKQVKKQAR